METTRKFSEWEKEIIQKLCSLRSSSCDRMEDLLSGFFFTEEHGRALIIQAKTHYAVYYLSTTIFNEDERQVEIAKLFEMIALIRWLADQGLITLFRNDGDNEKQIYFMQDNFTHAKIAGNTLVLNEKGEFTKDPDTIYDKNGNVLYKGFIHAKATFDMIFAATVGSCYITPAMQNLNSSFLNTKQTESETSGKDNNEAGAQPAVIIPVHEHPPIITKNADIPKPHKNDFLQIAITITAILSFCIVGYLLHSKMGSIEDKLVIVEQKQLAIGKVKTDTLPAIQQSDNMLLAIEPDSVGDYYGIDVSHWNGNVLKDIEQADSLSFAICKATEGNSSVDHSYHDNWGLIKKKQLIGGKYHFYIVHDDPHAQAEHFYKTVGKTDTGDLPLIIDIEFGSLSRKVIKTKETIQEELLQCLARVEELSGRKPMLYTNYYFAQEYLDNKKLGDYPLWLAEYSNLNHHKPRVPAVWAHKSYKIWQKSDRMNLRGMTVDYDVFHGTRKELVE